MSRIDTKIRLQLPLTARAEGYLKHRFLLLGEDALLEANFMRVPLWSGFILLKMFFQDCIKIKTQTVKCLDMDRQL